MVGAGKGCCLSGFAEHSGEAFALLRYLDDAICVIDDKARVAYLNPSFTELFHLEPATWLTRPFVELATHLGAPAAASEDGARTWSFTDSAGKFRLVQDAWKTLDEPFGKMWIVRALLLDRQQTESPTTATEQIDFNAPDKMGDMASDRTLFDHALDAFFLLDEQLLILDVNHGVERMLGYSREELIGEHVRKIVFPEEHADIEPRLNTVVPGKPLILETSISRRDGTAFLSEAYAVRLPDGRILGVARDASVRKWAVDELIKSEREKAVILNGLSEHVALYDADMRYVWVNRAMCGGYGFSEREVIGRHCYEVHHGRSEPCEVCPTRETFQSGKPVSRETIAHDQRYVLLRTSPLFDQDGSVKHVIEISLDVTDLREANIALARSEANLRRAEHLAKIGHWDWNVSCHSVLWSEELYRILGVNPGEQIPDFATMVYPEDRQIFLDAVEKVWNGAERFLVEVRAVRTDGRVVHLRDEAEVTRNDRGEPVRLFGFVQDISESKRVEREIRQYSERLALMFGIQQQLLALTDPQEVADRTLEQLRELVPYDHGVITHLEEDRKSLRIVGLRTSFDGDWFVGQVVTLNPRELKQEMWKGKTRRIDDIHELDNPTPVQQTMMLFGLRSYISHPLMVRGRLIGILTLGRDNPHSFTPDELAITEEIAGSLAVLMLQSQLHAHLEREASAKARLLREVNHRVQNNLTGIMGMLFAEKQRVSLRQNTDYQAAITDLIHRIEGLAAVHSLLSASEWAPVRFFELVHEIARNARNTLTPPREMRYQVTGINLLLPAKHASSLALVINELLTNVVKYALGERPAVAVHLHIASRAKQITLTVGDDGPGYPEAVLDDPQAGGVGLFLLRNIVDNDLNGTLQLDNDEGAIAHIQFPLPSGISEKL